MNKLYFDTKSVANDFLEKQKNLYNHNNGYSQKGIYYLSHGEYSKPDFKPVHYKDGWGIKKIHYFYDGTLNAPQDGRCVIIDGELVLEANFI